MTDEPKVNIEVSRLLGDVLHRDTLERNWQRFCITINGFWAKYNAWPKRIRMYEVIYLDLRDNLLSEEAFAQVLDKLEVIPVPPEEEGRDAALVSEDDEGRRFQYGVDGWDWTPDESAVTWLGVSPES